MVLAEREGFQHRIKSLEAQVINLEQMIEDVDSERRKEPIRAEAEISSYFGGNPVSNFSNNSNHAQEVLENSFDQLTDHEEV